MKKYRLTKITVRTTEIISLAKDAAEEIQNPVCPVCRTPLSTFLSAVAENPIDETHIEKRTAKILPEDLMKLEKSNLDSKTQK